MGVSSARSFWTDASRRSMQPDAPWHFDSLAMEASPGPWLIAACDRPDRVRVTSRDAIVERDLPVKAAAYLVALRTMTDLALRGGLSRRRRRMLGSELALRLRAVNADWMFVAKTIEGVHFYLHDCVTRLGAGTLSPADAAFIDAAKAALPGLLADPNMRAPRKVFLPWRQPGSRLSQDEIAGEYAQFAADARDFHQLSGRYDVAERTIATIAPIVAHLPLTPSDHVLDIGCGDATFLTRVAAKVAACTGTVVSDAELARLRAAPALARFAFRQATFDDIAALPDTYDAIVANGCFHFVMDTRGAHRALAAMTSRLRDGGRIWIGELHTRNHRRPKIFPTSRQALAHAWRCHGPRFAARYALHLWRRRHTPRLIVEREPPDGWWTCSPANMARIAQAHGLTIADSWDCYDLTGDTFYRVEGRRSYLLVRM